MLADLAQRPILRQKKKKDKKRHTTPGSIQHVFLWFLKLFFSHEHMSLKCILKLIFLMAFVQFGH